MDQFPGSHWDLAPGRVPVAMAAASVPGCVCSNIAGGSFCGRWDSAVRLQRRRARTASTVVPSAGVASAGVASAPARWRGGARWQARGS